MSDYDQDDQDTVVVTVGRNVGDKPMRLRDWEEFTRAIENTMRTYCHEIYFVGHGVGNSEEWGREEAFTVVAEWPSSRADAALASALLDDARFYGQEAIAVTFGTSTMPTTGGGR